MNKIWANSFKPVVKAVPAPSGSLYCLRHAPQSPALSAGLDDPIWQSADVARVDQFHATSSNHHPETQVRALHHSQGLSIRFEVKDQFVRARCTENQMITSKDSCVECFLQPAGRSGYFNFEVNCGGTLLLYYIEDPARPAPANGKPFKQFTVLPPEHLRLIQIHSTLPKIVEPEIQTTLNWCVSFFVPWELFEAYAPNLSINTPWRGNFFKCGDDSSHPHWASWSGIGEILRFHQPQRFGVLQFDEAAPASAQRREWATASDRRSIE